MNEWEAKARTQKALRIIEALAAHGIDPDTADQLTSSAWRDVARAAGVNPPSQATIDQALRLYRLRVAGDEARRPF